MELSIGPESWEENYIRGFWEGYIIGWGEGFVRGALTVLLDLEIDIETIIQHLANRLGCDQEKARRVLRDYLKEHPQEGAYLQETLP